MAKVTATWADGMTASWADGEVSGSPGAVGLLAHMAPVVLSASPAPEMPPVDVRRYAEDPVAFAALALALRAGRPTPRLELEDVSLVGKVPEGAW